LVINGGCLLHHMHIPNGIYENACLYYSDDGLVWNVPPGVKNPIGTLIKSEYNSKAYGSDPYGSDPYGSDPHGSDPYGSDSHLIYNPDAGKFMLYYVIGDVCGNVTIQDRKLKHMMVLLFHQK
jgi:hypothetical protein